MHPHTFKKPSQAKPSRYNSALKLSALSVMVAALSGCGENLRDCNGFWDKTFGRDDCSMVAGINQVTLTGTAIDDPIAGAMLKVTTLDGKEIGTATTQADGTFAVSVPEPYLTDPILLQVSGGTMAGQPFTGTLKAIYTPQDGRTGLNLTPVTTLVSHLADSEAGSDLVAKRNAALNKLVALGMVDLQSWRKVADTPFDLGTIAFRISDLGGVTPWLNTIQTDIADGELSKDEMMMGFPKAHGGVQKVVVGMDTLSMAMGDKRQLQVSADGLPENTTLTLSLENAPEWVKVSNGVVVFDVPENAQAGVRQTFNLVVTANGVPVGRKKALSVYVTPMTLLLEGSLGVAGGKIENQWKDIALSAPVGALKQQYTFKYYAGVDDGGQILFRSKNTPQMTEEESAQVDLIQPSPDILKENYLTPANTAAPRSVRQAKANTLTASDFAVATACTINNQWIDYLGDGFSFTHIWRGQDAVYHDSDGWDKFGFTRVYKQHPDYSHITQCSSRLWATNAWNDDSVKGREPVLFVHGFKSSGNLGGFDGEEYFGRFPNLITQVNSLPFLFEWRTNARFEDVAAELGDAIKLISEKTGKKVHIVAHSFGGLLSRTLIQGLANVPNTQNVHPVFTAQWAEQNIATLTTVGTPHSGIAGGSDDAIEGLPNGRDGTEGAGITACYATTCYQAGRRGDLPFGNQTRHPFRSSVLVNGSGDIIRKLLHTPYPTGIYTQVLIGLGGFNDFGLDDSTTDASDIQITCSKTAENLAEGQCRLFYTKTAGLENQGDGLISFYGQRFYPQERDSPLINGTNLKEHILGFDASWSVTNMSLAFDDKFHNAQPQPSPQFFSGRDVNHDGIRNFWPDHRQFLWDVGVYSHRTGLYREYLETDGDSSGVGDTDLEIAVRQFSEVGLQNCDTTADACQHATWKYFVAEALPKSFDFIVLPTKLAATGRLAFNGDVPAGAWVRVYANGSLLTQVEVTADGSFNAPVDFSPNTNYALVTHALGYRMERLNGDELGLTTGATATESSLNFGVINMESKDFAEGSMKVVVTDAVTGRSVSGYKVVAYNSVNNGVDNRDEQETTATPTPTLTTLPKGSYRVEIEKAGYQTAKQVCDVKETQLVTCQINIVPTTSVSDGQLVSVLRWDVNPNDLDSHLIKYNANGQQQYHIYYSNRNGGTDNLDVDDTTSYGPETVTINQLDPTANYVYAIYHYGGSGSITTTSQAQVSVLQNGKPVRIYKAPLTGEGRWWKVFEVQNGQVIPCQSNCMYSSEPQPTPRSRDGGQPRWLQDAMRVPMPKK